MKIDRQVNIFSAKKYLTNRYERSKICKIPWQYSPANSISITLDMRMKQISDNLKKSLSYLTLWRFLSRAVLSDEDSKGEPQNWKLSLSRKYWTIWTLRRKRVSLL